MMLDYYAVLNTTDTQDLYTLMNYANVVTGNLFMPVMLFVIGIIWILGSVFIGKPFSRSLMYAGFMCSIISVLFVIMGWLNTNYMYFCFLMTAVGLVWVRLSESYS